MVKKRVKATPQKITMLTVFILVLVVFVVGILIGSNIRRSEANDLQTLLQESELNTESYLIEQELIGGSSIAGCDLAMIRIQDLSSQLYELGQKLNSENPRKELGERNYNLLKRKFHLMQMRTYLLFYSIQENCNESTHTVLYYYKQNDLQSQEQGMVLDRAVENFDLNVFAIEYNYSQDLNFIEEYYNVTAAPAVVIDYGKALQGFQDYNTLQDYFKE